MRQSKVSESTNRKSLGIHSIKEAEVLKRKEKKLLEFITKYKQTVDRTRPENTGITNQEISGLKGEIRKLVGSVDEAKTMGDYERIWGETEACIEALNNLKRERAEDV